MKLSYFLMFLKNDILSMLMLMLSKTHKGVRRLAVEKFHNLSQNKRLVVLTMNYQLVLNQNSIKISDQHGKQPLFVAFLQIKILSSWKWVVKEHAMDDWVIYNEHCAIKCLLQLLFIHHQKNCENLSWERRRSLQGPKSQEWWFDNCKRQLQWNLHGTI